METNRGKARHFFRAVAISAVLLVFSAGFCFSGSGDEPWHDVSPRFSSEPHLKTPLDMEALCSDLSLVRAKTRSRNGWPRQIRFTHEHHDFASGLFRDETRTLRLESEPERIIPHAVGVAEILWAICPRNKILALHEFAVDPQFSLIADRVDKSVPIFSSKQTERVIGLRPDLVFTVFYSGADFKQKLREASIPYVDLGYFGGLKSIREQILLLGKIIGEEPNAEALVNLMDSKISRIEERLRGQKSARRVLFYNTGGYVTGKRTSFTAMCEIIGAVNVAAEKGVESLKQIDHELLLRWDPDVIVVPAESHLKQVLKRDRILAHCRAVRRDQVYELGGVYLSAQSQYVVPSANLLAAVVYKDRYE